MLNTIFILYLRYLFFTLSAETQVMIMAMHWVPLGTKMAVAHGQLQIINILHDCLYYFLAALGSRATNLATTGIYVSVVFCGETVQRQMVGRDRRCVYT